MGMRDAINALNLTKFFENLILSYEVGVRKPEEKIYLAALKAVSLKASECIFVADEISDLEGARNVGMSSMLVRQGSSTLSEAKNPSFKPDFECNHISEITQFL
jgi:putative hydrolase of the HAD superfamily